MIKKIRPNQVRKGKVTAGKKMLIRRIKIRNRKKLSAEDFKALAAIFRSYDFIRRRCLLDKEEKTETNKSKNKSENSDKNKIRK